MKKKKEETAAGETVNKTALSKKFQAQQGGLDLLEKLTLDLTRIGIGNMNARSAREIEEKAKQLGNAYLPGPQSRTAPIHDGSFAARTATLIPRILRGRH